ncbi:MAG: molecular chaperone [Parafannyhessea sp.]|uniref:TorD/DmsD family molecular chaperone n=1 Tax=Parafannyhessea sp. TaxID=2847324 RepID=UPI003EFBC1C3
MEKNAMDKQAEKDGQAEKCAQAGQSEFATACALRAQVYRMLGSLYFTELTEEQIRTLAAVDYASFAELDEELARGAKEIERALRHVNSSTREELAVDYAHTFLAAGAGRAEARAVPYESVYLDESGLLMGPSRDRVYKAMLKEGVLPDATLNVPEDHLSFECEFMATMADRAAAAFEAQDRQEALRCVDVQREFLHSHLAAWIDVFCRAVDQTCRTKFYRGVALMTRAFVRFDAELLDEQARLLG